MREEQEMQCGAPEAIQYVKAFGDIFRKEAVFFECMEAGAEKAKTFLSYRSAAEWLSEYHCPQSTVYMYTETGYKNTFVVNDYTIWVNCGC